MRVLIACEQSGVVRDAFRRRGHAAWSCDIEPGNGEFSKFHHQCDVRAVMNRSWWDLMIAHPPCTYLTNAGVKHLYLARMVLVTNKHGVASMQMQPRKEHGINPERWEKMREGAEFFNLLWKFDIPRVAVENPIMHKFGVQLIGTRQTQVIQPWMFGHKESKGTCLWLRGLPKLNPTDIVGPPPKIMTPEERRSWNRIHFASPGPDRADVRSETFPGIAEATVAQWGC